MTNAEAIKGITKVWKGYTAAYAEISKEDVEAFDMAIEALSNQCAISEQVENLKEALTESDHIYEASEWWKNYIRSRKSRDDVPDANVGKIPYKKSEIIHCESCKHWTHTPLKGYGLGRCDVHDDDLMTRYGSCESAERRNDG